MISEDQEVLEIAPWVSAIPSLAIMIHVLGFNLADCAGAVSFCPLQPFVRFCLFP
jgi:ABC-type antimicrobial peptide transport system permease subunit